MMILLLFVAMFVGLAQSWDVATSSGDDKIYFYVNEILTNTVRVAYQKPLSLTYDEVHNIMLYVDKRTNNDQLCGYDLMTMENKCFVSGNGRNIHDLAFDPVSERVFFTDTNDKSINWISLKPSSYYTVNVLVRVYNAIPRDIVVDSCKGYVYWLNTSPVRPTIERVRLDGTGAEVFENLSTVPVSAYYTLEPNSLGIDQHRQMIYWMEPANTTEYHLVTKSLKANADSFYIIRVFDPKQINIPSNTLTVSKDHIFHLEYAYGINAVYAFATVKSSVINTSIEKKTVYSEINMPLSIVANYKIKDQIQDCEALSRVKLITECKMPLCVHGTEINGRAACKCTPGYIGERCDLSVCENYCLQGSCSFNSAGLPICRCNAGYSGERCHISICENYCLQGNCTFTTEGVPKCRCNKGYSGKRCEVNSCQEYCLNDGECFMDEAGQPSCTCPSYYAGSRCENETNDTN